MNSNWTIYYSNVKIIQVAMGETELDTNLTEQKPVSVLYVKRKRSDAPNQSLIVSFNAKKQKIFNEFTFVESTNSATTQPIEDVVKKHKSKPQVSAATIKDKIRDQKTKSAKSSRYNIISSTRHDSGVVYTASEVEGDDEIVCNAEKMLSEKLTLSDTSTKPFVSNGEEEWVYDVYLSNDICAGTIDSIYPELELIDHVADEDDDDSDSNDENYWANDYPDEKSSGSDSDNSEGFYYNMNVSNNEYRQRKVSDDYYDTKKTEDFNFGVVSDTSSSEGEEDVKEGS